MKKFIILLICAICFFYTQAQLTFTSTNFINDEKNIFVKTFEGETSDSSSVYLQAEFSDGSTNYSAISEFGLTHSIAFLFPRKNGAATIKAIAFNSEGPVESELLTAIEITDTPQDELVGELVENYGKPVPNNNLLLSTETDLPAEKEAIILSPEGQVAWAETLPNSSESISCNAINYQNDYIIITDCHTITKKKLDGSEEQVYQFEMDSLSGANSFFHGKAIINRDGNLVSLFAHKTIVDKSIVGGSVETNLVSDGIVEFDLESGKIVNLYSPMSENNLCNYYRPLNVGGKYASVFGDSIEYYRLASAIAQDDKKTYYLTMDTSILFPQGGITNVNITSSFCEIDFLFNAPNAKNFVFYKDDHYVNARSFSVLPNGNFFMLTNYPDTSIMLNPYPLENDTIISVTGNGTTTRALKYILDPGYMGVYVMFWTIDDYNYPAAAYTEMDAAIWLETDEMLGFSSTNNTLYQINDEDEITGAMTFSETVSPVSVVENFDIIAPTVTIMNIDTLVCNNQMEIYELEGMPAGGFFTGVPVTDGNIFDPTNLVVGETYTITYNYGPYTASFDIEVDQCVSVNDLMEMGGLESDILPNPVTSNSALLKYQLAAPGQVTLQVINLNGQLLKNENFGFRRAGVTAEVINMDNLPAGTYIYQLISDGMISSKRFNIVK